MIRDEGLVRNKAVYLAIGVTCHGAKEIPGLWIEQTEGGKFWMRVVIDLKGRGVRDILIAVVEGLKAFPETITAAFPDTVVQICIVHLIHYSMQFVSWKGRKAIAKALEPLYGTANAEAAAAALGEFEQDAWGQKYPPVVASWHRKWEEVAPFFAFSAEVHKIIYTTNAIESLHSQVRKTIRNKGHFPSDYAATKLIYLSPRQIEEKWKRLPKEWHAAKYATHHTIRRTVHSDRMILSTGSHTEFRTLPSSDYQRYLTRNTLLRTMSAVGHCGDNAACKASSACSSASVSTGRDTLRSIWPRPMYLTTLSDFITRGCGVESPSRIRSFQLFPTVRDYGANPYSRHRFRVLSHDRPPTKPLQNLCRSRRRCTSNNQGT